MVKCNIEKLAHKAITFFKSMIVLKKVKIYDQSTQTLGWFDEHSIIVISILNTKVDKNTIFKNVVQ